MRKRTIALVVLAFTFSFAMGISRAQEANSPKVPQSPKPVAAYHLDFALNELEDGKKINTRQYAMDVLAGRPDDSAFVRNLAFGTKEIKIGTRVPIETEQGKMEYMDIGTKILCKTLEEGGGLTLDVRAEVSSLVSRSDADRNIPAGKNPALRQLSIEAATAITLGKATSLGMVDDPDSKRQFQLEVTVTKLK